MGPGFGEFARVTFQQVRAIPPESTGHIYLNPSFTVTAAATVPEVVFLRQAQRACILWKKQLARWLTRGALRRAVKRATPGERMLVFSGTLILNGRPAHIKRLNDFSDQTVSAPC
jgi:hypothetical protein